MLFRSSWPDDRFDLIWILARDADDEEHELSMAAQSLLDGDEGA